jgi:hypothetical protein
MDIAESLGGWPVRAPPLPAPTPSSATFLGEPPRGPAASCMCLMRPAWLCNSSNRASGAATERWGCCGGWWAAARGRASPAEGVSGSAAAWPTPAAHPAHPAAPARPGPPRPACFRVSAALLPPGVRPLPAGIPAACAAAALF